MPRPQFIEIELNPHQIKKFWSKVIIGGDDECWPWTGFVNPHGYGVINLWSTSRNKYITFLSNRIAYTLGHNRQPSMCVLHTCDNAKCCNFKHLYQGTDADNVRDRESRHRRKAPIGSAAGLAKLTEESVIRIKARLKSPDVNMSAIAREYGVTQGTIQHIKDGRTWKHV